MSDSETPDSDHLAGPMQALPGGFSPGYGDSSDPYDHAVPPGYDWPTHGGYLGCLLGLLASCPVAFVASTFIPPLARYDGVPGWIVAPLTVVVFLVIFFAVGRFGFILGKRFLREYPQPARKTWGEDDDYVDPALAEIAPAPDDENDTRAEPRDEPSEQQSSLRDL
ncbi:MAG: hypothetical protein ACRDHP_20075 [Ktedonobacterales bacterium]